MQIHDLVDIRRMPVLASLAILAAALLNTVQALEAFHPHLATAAWNPEADTLLRLAQAIRANVARLQTLVHGYQQTATPERGDIRRLPELASLATLDSALLNTVEALEAAHQDLLISAWNPDADPLLRLAANIQANASSLRLLLDHYQAEAACKLVNDIPW